MPIRLGTRDVAAASRCHDRRHYKNTAAAGRDNLGREVFTTDGEGGLLTLLFSFFFFLAVTIPPCGPPFHLFNEGFGVRHLLYGVQGAIAVYQATICPQACGTDL